MSSAAAPADPRKAVLVDSRTISWHGETWSLEKKLGSGRFASVYEMHCSTNPSKEKVAAKVTQLAGITPWARSQINEELAIWQTLKHPNVVRLHGHVTNESQHVLLLELAQGGELFDRIVTMQFFSEQLAARQVCGLPPRS
jgi:serine/threonine protein kinase